MPRRFCSDFFSACSRLVFLQSHATARHLLLGSSHADQELFWYCSCSAHHDKDDERLGSIDQMAALHMAGDTQLHAHYTHCAQMQTLCQMRVNMQLWPKLTIRYCQQGVTCTLLQALTAAVAEKRKSVQLRGKTLSKRGSRLTAQNYVMCQTITYTVILQSHCKGNNKLQLQYY